MRMQSKSSQFELFRVTRQSPKIPPEVRLKVLRLLARMLRQRAARGGDRPRVHEAKHE